jgi:hypothetical protein
MRTWSILENPRGALPQPPRRITEPLFLLSSVHPTRFHDQSPRDAHIRSQVHDPPAANPIRVRSTECSVTLEKRTLPFVGTVLPSAVRTQLSRCLGRGDQLISTSDCFDVGLCKPTQYNRFFRGHPLSQSFARVDARQRSTTPKAQFDNSPLSRPLAGSVFAHLVGNTVRGFNPPSRRDGGLDIGPAARPHPKNIPRDCRWTRRYPSYPSRSRGSWTLTTRAPTAC